MSPQQALQDLPMADIAVRGRGEKPLIQLLNKGLSLKPPIKGVYYNPEDKNSSRQDYADSYPIDDIPPIDYRIWVANPIQERKIIYNGQETTIEEISLFETAGCPFSCTFCSTPVLVWTRSRAKTVF